MPVVVIDREFAVGDLEIARIVAKGMDVDLFNHAIARDAAIASGIEMETIEQLEEDRSKGFGFLRAISPASYDAQDSVFAYESKAIVDIAKKGPCVILGRCADAVLEEAGIPCFRVFLFADDEYRVQRAMEELELEDASDAKKILHREDVHRHAYFAYYTGKDWGQREYDLGINVGLVGPEVTAQLILQAVQAL